MVHVLLALALGAAPGAPARPMSAQQAAAFPAAIQKGDLAVDQLRDRIYKRLQALIIQGGPTAAVGLCMTEAPRVATEVGRANGVELGRTSARTRNPANAPRPWAAAYVAASAGKRADEVQPAAFDLGDRIGMLRPIPMMPACARCHGAPDALAADVKAELARRYPHDRGTGFAPGEVRGFFWVEVKKR